MNRCRPLSRVRRATIWLAAAAAACVAVVVALAPTRGHADAYQTLTADQVQKLLGVPDVRIFDANDQDTFRRNHLPGAVHIGDRPLASLLPADKAARLVFYCTSPG